MSGSAPINGRMKQDFEKAADEAPAVEPTWFMVVSTHLSGSDSAQCECWEPLQTVEQIELVKW